MPHASNGAVPGLQALIFCGPGSSFPTFTSNPDENPKALLPVANRPMVWYALDFCYRMGINDVTLICPPSAAPAINSAFNTNPVLTGLPHRGPNVLAPQGLDQNMGTAEILRLPEVKEIIKQDFMVLPCDLICDFSGEKLVQAWMVAGQTPSDALQDSGAPRSGLGVWYETKTAQRVKNEETDFVAIEPLPTKSIPPPKDSIFSHLGRLLYSTPTDSLNDLMDERSGLPLRHGLAAAHPRARILSTQRDAHIYIFPRWILDFVEKNKHLESIGEDVIGWWAKADWQEGLSEALGIPESLATDTRDESVPARGQVPPILAYIHPKQPEAGLIRRVDTAQLLLNVSLQLAKLPSVEEVGPDDASPLAHAKKVAYPEGVKPRTTITKVDSLVGDNVSVQEKTSIKESVVGANCQINEGAKLLQCVLMDGAIVGKNCKLTRCILGKRCVIGDGSTLTGCEVQESLLVDARSDLKDERLMSSEGLEATEEEMQELMDDEGALLSGGEM